MKKGYFKTVGGFREDTTLFMQNSIYPFIYFYPMLWKTFYEYRSCKLQVVYIKNHLEQHIQFIKKSVCVLTSWKKLDTISAIFERLWTCLKVLHKHRWDLHSILVLHVIFIFLDANPKMGRHHYLFYHPKIYCLAVRFTGPIFFSNTRTDNTQYPSSHSSEMLKHQL